MAPHTPVIASEVDDLRDVCGWDAPFFTAVLPARSDVADAEHRLEVRWGNARRQLSPQWTDDDVSDIESLLAGIGHDGGAALAIVRGGDGHTLTEFLPASPGSAAVHEGVLPALAPIIEGRQRSLAHVVVEADKSGADIVAFAGANVLATDRVDGEELHIHRGHPGGWSQQRFQQRAENTWNDNADDVADTAASLAEQIGAQLIAVAGPPRAKAMVADALAERTGVDVVKVDSGDPDGIAADVVTLLDDAHARSVAALSERFRDGLANDAAVAGIEATIDALVEGRVDTLLVNDDWTDDTVLDRRVMDIEPGARAVDAAVAAALRTDADVVVVPNLAAMEGPVGALLRW
ncbi:MAG: hypothetical protein HKN44_04145 [Ilumatobacter sp.]|nr:hypothetical protein [Ilumatobacter sp.]